MQAFIGTCLGLLAVGAGLTVAFGLAALRASQDHPLLASRRA
jgi:hypothetical protein